ncbi:MAG: sugar ABC transporter permease [Chloroflexi bacterium]|nr:sugar ABC transporter permease [Chloroflexota bacterium]
MILALFLYAPALDNLRLSTLLARLGTDRTAFVCVDNFTKLLEPRQNYGQTLYATFLISFFTVIIGLAISLMIAYVAYQPVRGASIYRTLLIWPYAISPPVAGIIFGMVFNEGAGIMNHLIRSGGGVPVQWLQSASIAPWTIIAASVWKSMGFNILFYIAGLQNVPKDLIEAAAIDGAGLRAPLPPRRLAYALADHVLPNHHQHHLRVLRDVRHHRLPNARWAGRRDVHHDLSDRRQRVKPARSRIGGGAVVDLFSLVIIIADSVPHQRPACNLRAVTYGLSFPAK